MGKESGRAFTVAPHRNVGDYTGMTEDEFVAARKEVEDMIGLKACYDIERATVERAPAPRRSKAP